jgi:hypothetical protein
MLTYEKDVNDKGIPINNGDSSVYLIRRRISRVSEECQSFHNGNGHVRGDHRLGEEVDFRRICAQSSNQYKAKWVTKKENHPKYINTIV